MGNALKPYAYIVISLVILTGCGRRAALSVVSRQLTPSPSPTFSPAPSPTPTPTPTMTSVPTGTPPPWIPAPTFSPVPTLPPPTPPPTPPPAVVPVLKCSLEAAAAPRADLGLPMQVKCNLPLQSIKMNNKPVAPNEPLVLMPSGNQYVGIADVVSVDGQTATAGFVDTVPFFCRLETMEIKLADGGRNGRVVIRMHQNAPAGATLTLNNQTKASPGPADVDFAFTGLPQGTYNFAGGFLGTACVPPPPAVVPGNYYELYAQSASRVYQNETPDRAVDGDTTTYWGSGDYTGSITLCFRDGIVTPSRIDIRWSQSPADFRDRTFEFSHSTNDDMSNRTKFNKSDRTANESITTIAWDPTKPVKCFKIDQRDRFASWMGVREIIAYR